MPGGEGGGVLLDMNVETVTSDTDWTLHTLSLSITDVLCANIS